jgi:hypothetical protein
MALTLFFIFVLQTILWAIFFKYAPRLNTKQISIIVALSRKEAILILPLYTFPDSQSGV